MRVALLLLCLLVGPALAQPTPSSTPTPATTPTDATDDPAAALSAALAAVEVDERGWPVGGDAGVVADAAVATWLERDPVALTDLAALTPAEVCERLPAILSAPPPPAGTRVILDDRRPLAQEGDPDDDRSSFTYAAVRPNDVLDVVQVDLLRSDGAWSVERVGFRVVDELSGVRAWLQTPPAAIAFTLFTLLVALGLARPSPLRRALATGLQTARDHRRTVAVTMVLLYSVFGLGVLGGASLPPTCDVAIMTVLEGALNDLGARQAYGSGDVARAAVVTFYQNFVVVTFSLHFFLVMLLGVPSYLVAIPQFFVLGVPFGLLAGTSMLALVPVVVLVLLELTAYFLVVAGGGILLGTLFRRGFGAYLAAVRTSASLLVPAGLLLLIGAWYEAVLLVLIGI